MFKFNALKAPMLLWCAATLFFAFQFVLRLSIGIFREEIIEKYNVDVSAFGDLAGYYYLGYAGMQIPIGMMLDRFNFKYVSFISILVCTAGILTFILFNNWHLLLIGRFMIGVGSASGFLTVAKIIKICFPKEYHQIMMGFTFAFGIMGAMFGGIPLKIIFNNYGYYTTFSLLALTCFIIALIGLIINVYIPYKKQIGNKTSFGVINTFKLLFNPLILFIGICGGLMVGTLAGFADVWAIPFFMDIYYFTENQSIFLVSMIFLGMCLGSPILSYLNYKIKSTNIIIFALGTLMSLIFILLFYYNAIPYYIILILMLILGMLCSYQSLVFNLVGSLVPSINSGVSIALVNCINMAFGHFFHHYIGYSMDYGWDGVVNALGIPIYNIENFTWSLGVIPVCCTIGQFGFLLLECYFKKFKISNYKS